MSQRQRLVNLGVAVAVAVVAVVVILGTTGGSDSTAQTESTASPEPGKTKPTQASTPKPQVTKIEVAEGEVVGGVTKLEVKQGERVRFEVTADVADEVHVHAYDFMKDIEQPGDTVSFDFPAKITGISEIELESAGLEIATLRVDQ